tara:strand:+ start:2953 stop:3924 length:972 start_codon:yes stop_codon:yes gene_type:complete
MQSNQFSIKIGGHITLLFSIQSKSFDLDEQGSRGAGICIHKGVEVSTTARKGNGNVIITSDIENLSVKLYNLIIEEMVKDFKIIKKYDWEFLIKSDLPFSQGFGCSASGALSAIIGILKIIKEEENIFQNAITIAHRVERKMSSGLGDVTALSAGGVELRVEPGLPFPPNNGKIINWNSDFPMILCWERNKQKHTSEYIDNEDWKKSISDAGEQCISILNKKEWNKNIWNDLLEQSKIFGETSRILFDSNRKEILYLIENVLNDLKLNSFWEVRLCMLGSSAVILPRDIEKFNEEDLEQILKRLKKLKLNGCITKTNLNPIRI